MTTPLESQLETAFAGVDGIHDIAPEHPDGTFTIPADAAPAPFIGEQTIKFMDYGVELHLSFDATDDQFLPDEAVRFGEMDDVMDNHRERIDVTERRNMDSDDSRFFLSVRPGDNHDFDGDYDVYPGDTISKNPMPRGWLCGGFDGCTDEELSLVDTIPVADDRLIVDDDVVTAIHVLSTVGVLDDVLGVTAWVQSFCQETLDWDIRHVEVTGVDVRTFTDATAVTVTL